MLPELLDKQDKFKTGLTAIDTVEGLVPLQRWLNERQVETRRDIPPAWMEVLIAIVKLSEDKLQEAEPNCSKLVLSFETHIIARQVSRQRGDEKIQTRFVSDELGRINKHLQSFVNSIDPDDDTENICVIGWSKNKDKRGIGLATAKISSALLLYSGELDKHIIGQQLSRWRKNANNIRDNFSNPRLSAFIAGCAVFLSYFLVQNYLLPTTDIVNRIVVNKELRCGVDGSLRHFSMFNSTEKKWWGLDVELCHAIATAMNVKPNIIEVSDSHFYQRVTVLSEEKLDVLFRNTSLTAARDLESDIDFGPYYFYEREYFLDLKSTRSSKVVSDDELAGQRVCVKPGTSNESTLQRIAVDVSISIVTQDKNQKDLSSNLSLLKLLRDQGEPICDYVFGNYYVLKQLNTDQDQRQHARYPIKPYAKSRLDPLAPVLPKDERWRQVVTYIIYTLIYADRIGVNSYNMAELQNMGSQHQKDFLKGEGMASLGLPDGWVINLLENAGSYDEIYYRAFICDFADCPKPSYEKWRSALTDVKTDRWPNFAFNDNDLKPGLLHTPSF